MTISRPAATPGSSPDSSRWDSQFRTFDELALLLHASEVACCVQNMRLACEAMGLGAWAMGGYSDDLVLGAYPEVAVGLGVPVHRA